MIFTHKITRHNLCYMIPDKQWFLNENTLLPKHNYFEQIIVDGIENALFISSILMFSRFILGQNSPLIINKLTTPILNLSKKIMDFNSPPIQFAVATSFISLFLGIDLAVGYEKKSNICKNLIGVGKTTHTTEDTKNVV